MRPRLAEWPRLLLIDLVLVVVECAVQPERAVPAFASDAELRARAFLPVLAGVAVPTRPPDPSPSRIQAELAAAEEEWQEWAIARRRVGTVLAPDDGNITEEEAAPGPRDADTRSASRPAAKPKPKSQVPVWREGLPGRCCRWTISAFSRPSRTGTGFIKGRSPARSWL